MKIRQLSITILFVSALFLISCGKNPTPPMKERKSFDPPVNYEEASRWADSMVNLMTLEEKTTLIGGVDIFFTHGIPRLNIPSVFMADATQGVHLRTRQRDVVFEKVLDRSTSFPSPILLASTWNKELAGEYAKSIGEECRAGGIAVLLGPGMNIYRMSQCGRNFEYFGEDPYLAGRMIENYVYGLQNTGTIATLKHFICNNTDYYRRKSNSIVDERALHEIYLPAFRAGIDAGAMAVMTSYNLVNGEWSGQSGYVIDTVLRGDMGFKWLVMTDWWSVYDGVKLMKSGQDLEMPGAEALENAAGLVREGKVGEPDLDKMVSGILKTFYAMQAFGRQKDTSYLRTFDQHEKVALNTAREGIVLLENDGILPLKNIGNRQILVTGYWIDSIAHGGGAATVEGYNNVYLMDALAAELDEKLTYIPDPSEAEITNADIVIFNAGTFDSEGWDRSFDLPEKQEKRIRQYVELNKNTIIVVNSGSGINMSAWNKKAAAVLYAWYGGQSGNTALAEILSGKVNPSGKLPVTIEKRFEDSPGYGYIPEGESLYTGWNGEGEKSHGLYSVHYTEGVFVGYRWYEHKGIEPLYPFGYGLSYTTFKYSGLQLSKQAMHSGDVLEVKFTVKNTGDLTGAEIAQVYVSDPESSVPRPVKELKGFTKVTLNAGESIQVSIILDHADFSYWDPEKKAWYAEPGKFDVLVGSSSADILLNGEVELME